MERPNVSREELVRVLVIAMRSKGTITGRLGRQGGSVHSMNGRIRELVRRLHAELAETLADRLLDTRGDNRSLSRNFVRRKAICLARELGTFWIEGVHEFNRNAIAEPTIDFALALRVISYPEETLEELWNRVNVVVTLSRSCGLSPEQYLKNPLAEDWILRLTTSPDVFRAREIEQLDELHPDSLVRHVKAFQAGVNRALGDSPFAQDFRIELMINVPKGDAYWEFRADRIQVLEERIRRIWPPPEEGDSS
ncbi:hypothetical protein EPN81_03245 [Patescibacteria group bacterium]|nr:MAG: hypothetical protein EPN81_03245 [Patescibacteria group bacterium]